ncbi:MAG: HD domain-containing protein [Humidesulfovibrio sp.]|nr:HD domain-containing protein [Humidesulfovibrio sp.]
MSKGRILVVEDEAIVALDIQARLTRLGFEVVGHAATGAEALRLAECCHPDLVLMDVLLSGPKDGIDTAGELILYHHLPVIYLTAMTDQTTLERAKQSGPSGYLSKPFEDHELSLAIEMALVKFEADNRLKDSERLLATTLGSLAEAVISTDKIGLVTYLNAAAIRLLGGETASAIGLPWTGLFSILDEASREPVEGLEEICVPRGEHPLCEDMILVTLDGREVPVALSVSPLLAPGKEGARGGLQGRVLVVRNVALRKQAEENLRASMAELRTTFRQTVRALARLAEKRDPYTAGHQQRVAKLARAIGAAMGLSEDALEGLEMAGTLHDVGKVYVPAEILSKPARLSHMEMGIMKGHPEVGYEILHEVNFPWPVARIVLEHHERLDGSGYPAGLKDGEICREARIMAVADVVEAMSSHRPYRVALGMPRALKEIRSGRGRLYDPEAVDACLKLMENGAFEFEDTEPGTPDSPGGFAEDMA